MGARRSLAIARSRTHTFIQKKSKTQRLTAILRIEKNMKSDAMWWAVAFVAVADGESDEVTNEPAFAFFVGKCLGDK